MSHFSWLLLALFLLSSCGGGSGGSDQADSAVTADSTPPVITLVGDSQVTLKEGEPYEELGATAQDSVDGSVAVTIEGEVGEELGVYTVTYSAADSRGNRASETRTITIEEAYPGLRLYWREEFGDSEIDPTVWSYDIGRGNNGWGNNELQYYRKENSKVVDGLLVIEAKKENVQGSQYTSARIKTEGSHSFRYGRLDVRAKLPEGQGLWPAIWLLGANFTEIGWPFSGEIDVMEMVGGNGREDTIYGTAHWNEGGVGQPYRPVSYGGSYRLNGAETFADDFHTYSIEWNEDQIAWFVDDLRFHVMAVDSSENLAAFRKNFFIILNLAVGGNWPGAPDSGTDFPQRFEVDYLRLFQDPTNEPPELTLVGPSRVTLVTGSDFEEPGYLASDREDGDLGSEVTIEGLEALDSDTVGDYVLVYSVIDSGGLETRTERTVSVVDQASAQLELFSDGEINIDVWDQGINAFDEELVINGQAYASCSNDEGAACPNISWRVVDDVERGPALEIEHSNREKVTGLYIQSSQGLDLSSYSNGSLVFDVHYRSGTPSISLKVGCGYPCESGVITRELSGAGWETVSIPVTAFVDRGLDLSKVDAGLVIWATERNGDVFRLDKIRWSL